MDLRNKSVNAVQQYAPTLQKVLLFGLFFILLFLSFNVLKYFIVPVLWAAIIAYMTWPLYHSIHRWCGSRATLSATHYDQPDHFTDWYSTDLRHFYAAT